jgi:hypothetical protein
MGPPLPPSGCFGCGEPTHQMQDCKHIGSLIDKNVVRRNDQGCLVLGNSTSIRRRNLESWVQAIEWVTGQTDSVRWMQVATSLPEGCTELNKTECGLELVGDGPE